MAMTTKVHGVYGVVRLLNGPVYIDQIEATAVRVGNQRTMLSDGVDDQFCALIAQKPVIEFRTSAIAAALGVAGWDGLAVVPTTNEFSMWLRLRASAGLYTAGATHVLIEGHNGLLYPVSIEADLSGSKINMALATIYDGTNDPLVITGTQALAGTPAIDEAFVVGPVIINGVHFEGTQSVSVNMGTTLFELTSDGDLWPTFNCFAKRQPSIEILSYDSLSLLTFGLLGDKQGATDSLVYLKAIDENGGRVADNVASHISIAIDDGMIQVEDLSGESATPYQSRAIITPSYDGTNDVLDISTGVVITIP